MAYSIERSERIISASGRPVAASAPGIALRSFATAEIGAHGFSTGMATFEPAASLAYHVHEVSEAIIILSGVADIFIEDRQYRMSPYDCVHVPTGVAHSVVNASMDAELRVHSSFASAQPARTFVDNNSPGKSAKLYEPPANCPEAIVRFNQARVYELAAGAFFRDLFARRLGSRGICGGYGRFEPGSSLPCHIHEYDESITIVDGEATCQVQGREYALSGCDTAFVPRRRPHRFINHFNGAMAMIWVYAGDEPDREIISADYCSGKLIWPS
jgi:quercetin dioxygenase-like cupin family protein